MIGLMASEHFAKSPVLGFAIVALLIFVTVFTIVTVRMLFTRAAELETVARLPLEVSDEVVR